jgi:2-oxoglutarate dehydrogenase E1 component
VAFTTDTKFSRSGEYCTSIAKGLGAPVFHVNGDDVEAVSHVHELAAEWRQQFHSDAVIDITCYRKHGHNEIDEPSFTQPLMYGPCRAHCYAFLVFSSVGLGCLGLKNRGEKARPCGDMSF